MSECGFMYEDPLSLERVMECEESGLNLLLELKKSSSRRSSCFPSQDLNKASASSLYFSSSSFISSTDDGQRWLCQHWASSSSSLLPCSSLSLEFTMRWLRLRWQNPIQSKRKRDNAAHEWALSQRSNSSIMFTKWTLTLAGIFFVISKATSSLFSESSPTTSHHCQSSLKSLPEQYSHHHLHLRNRLASFNSWPERSYFILQEEVK